MASPAIIDIFAAAVLIVFVVFGTRRGLFRALAGLAVVVVALVGAGIIASALAQPVAGVAAPLIQERIETALESAAGGDGQSAQMPEDGAAPEDDERLSIKGLLEAVGLDGDVQDSLADRAMERCRTPAPQCCPPWWRAWCRPSSMRRCTSWPL